MAPSSSSYAPLPSSPSSQSTSAGHSRRSSSSSITAVRRGGRVKVAVAGAVAILLLGTLLSWSDGVGVGLQLLENWREDAPRATDLARTAEEAAAATGGHTVEEESIWTPVGLLGEEEQQEQDVGADADLSTSATIEQDDNTDEDEATGVNEDGPDVDVDEDVGSEEDSFSAEEDWQDISACSDTVKRAVALPSFWIIRELAPTLSYLVTPRSPVVRFPHACLTNAIFSARLVSSPFAGDGSETIRSLARPSLLPHSADYGLNLSQVVLPKGECSLEVRLEYGFLEGGLEAAVCGEGKKSCDALKTGEMAGEAVSYGGNLVPWEDSSKEVLSIGQDDLQVATPPLCTELSSFEGYWRDSTFHPTPQSTPCSLLDLSFPLAFLPDTTTPRQPIWLNFIGDSNTRNFVTLFIKMLGNGPKANAVVMDSPTKNGTVASIALRSRTGVQEYGNDAAPADVIITWSWWYQRAPTTADREQQWINAVSTNREKLLFLANATSLASWAAQLSLSSTIGKSSSPLARLAPSIRPTRTYLSLGSHGEALTSTGVGASLDYLFSEEGGIDREMREAIGLRLFTTTLVDSSAIPLDRFPHQDLTRNNAAIEAKNQVIRERPDIGGEGRVVDVEGITRGVTEDWMKVDKKGMVDAVHFDERVYREWARLVGTELMSLV